MLVSGVVLDHNDLNDLKLSTTSVLSSTSSRHAKDVTHSRVGPDHIMGKRHPLDCGEERSEDVAIFHRSYAARIARRSQLDLVGKALKQYVIEFLRDIAEQGLVAGHGKSWSV